MRVQSLHLRKRDTCIQEYIMPLGHIQGCNHKELKIVVVEDSVIHLEHLLEAKGPCLEHYALR